MSDVMHLLEDYRCEADVERGSVPDTELLSMKEEKFRLEKSLSEMDTRAKELGKANLSFLTQVYFCTCCFVFCFLFLFFFFFFKKSYYGLWIFIL